MDKQDMGVCIVIKIHKNRKKKVIKTIIIRTRIFLCPVWIQSVWKMDIIIKKESKIYFQNMIH